MIIRIFLKKVSISEIRQLVIFFQVRLNAECDVFQIFQVGSFNDNKVSQNLMFHEINLKGNNRYTDGKKLEKMFANF